MAGMMQIDMVKIQVGARKLRFENKEMHVEARERNTLRSSMEPFRHGSGHYGWIPSDVALVSSVTSVFSKVASTSSWNAANIFSVPISMVVIPHLLPLMHGLEGHL